MVEGLGVPHDIGGHIYEKQNQTFGSTFDMPSGGSTLSCSTCIGSRRGKVSSLDRRSTGYLN